MSPATVGAGERTRPYRRRAGAPAAHLDIFTPDATTGTHQVPVTTLFWTGSGDQLPHEYQFDFRRPQARTAWQQTLDFLRTITKE